MTNIDRIKKMNAIKMAEWISYIVGNCGLNNCPAGKLCREKEEYLSCDKLILAWLNSEVSK